MDDIKTIGLLNNLIQINNDRIEGYETATSETEENDLKILFAQFITTSKKCKEALLAEVLKLGGEPVKNTRVTGKFFRIWMDVKAAITNKNRKFILESCEYGEDVVKKNYEDTIREHGTDLSFEVLDILKYQYLDLKTDHDRIQAMSHSHFL